MGSTPGLGGERLLVGREAEMERLGECARLVRSGQPWVVLIQGVAGVGKTALVRQWLAGRRAIAGSLLRSFADASDSDLAFGSVSQLLAGVPQRRREPYPLLRDGGPPAAASPIQVGGQLLGLLDDLQLSGGSVAVIVEDVQWVDQASLQVLRFVLRRLEADHVLTVLTARSPVPEELRKLAEDQRWGLNMRLSGLKDEPIAELVRRMTGTEADASVVARLREHTDGNPLYLQSLLAEIPPDLLRSDQPDKAAWPVPTSLAASIHDQLRALPAQSRALVEAAAVLDTRVPLSTVGRLAGVDGPATVLQAALAANLMRWWPNEPTTPVMITHALQRDAVIEALAPQRRRELHHHAAGLVGEAAAWRHKVAAADGPDDDLARQLADAAQGYLVTGATERAATLLLWASDLAGTRAEHERLLLTAAVRLLFAEQVVPVQSLLPRIKACSPSPLRSVAMGTYSLLSGALDHAEAELTSAFEATVNDPAERKTAAFAGAYLLMTHLFSGNHQEHLRIARQVLALDEPDPIVDYIVKSNIAAGRARLDGAWAGLQELERIAPLPPAAQVTAANAWLLIIRGLTRVLCGMPTAGRDDLTHVLRLSQGGVSQGLEGLALSYLAMAYYWSGAWDEAAVQADFAITTAITSRRTYALGPISAYAAWVPAGRGDAARAQELLRTAGKHALPYSKDEVFLGWAVEAQARADWPAMLKAVDEGMELSGLFREVLWKPLQVEALLRTGRLDQAAIALTELSAMADTYPSLRLCLAWLSAEHAHARGDLPAAHRHYKAGLTLSATPDDHAVHRAFLEQAYGRFLAATDQTAQARTWLEHARERYAALEALPFMERCQSDLDAMGAQTTTTRPATVLSQVELTGREHDIAHLVGEGLTNKEIAARLYISSRTVEYHLGHIYAKFQFTNRRQLRDHIRQQTPRVS
ncbi:AAA family ATPase [Streptomyces sp. NPDC048639]|uniref:helix-turn-helix transcriptional regulator n=1 Tax=Streptomyces sp. NPDC048639 TaxID=3365581 RepID=UPI00371BD58E